MADTTGKKPRPAATGHDDVLLTVKTSPQRSGRNAIIRAFFQDYARNVRARPAFLLLLPALTFCILCTTGIVGVKLGADKYEADTRARAESVALDWAASFRLSAEKIFTPLVTLAMIIQLNPDVAKLEEVFPGTAQQLLHAINQERTTVQELQISPMGVVQLIYPLTQTTASGHGIDIFAQPALRGGALKTLEAHDLVLNGPLHLVGSNFATIARIPIYIQNSTLGETFGSDRNLPTNCTPPTLCYNPSTGEKFWGFATAISPMDDVKAGNDSRLDLLKTNRYNWLMTRPYTSTERNNSKLYRPETTDRRGDYVFANSSSWPSDRAVASDISVANAVWRVYLEPQEGWRPAWERGLMAAVVLCSAMFAGLVGIIMASWAQQRKLLDEVMASNVQLAETTAKLQEEKLRLDALLVRQYNLVAMLGKGAQGAKGGKGDTNNSDPDNSTSSKEGLTLDRIENMRRQLAVNSNSSLQDIGSIQTIELLGKGTFGKVYKGLWRGTVVAVKTMLLPSNMSGSEKREKMAVMEAAISSSLSHPNVVQTYTYAIRPIRELPSSQLGSEETVSEPSAEGAAASHTIGSLRLSSTSIPALHSYEVRLVLEYCDKGCLREALDSGAFKLPGGGVNYLAVLDTAADVAKAMLHLHSLNVLHSDLKCQNVMLATGNADGRGLVGKVGDFGLSLKMDCTETHISQVFQGTMTHMAPEIMLNGRVSKAADVYSFGICLYEMYTGGIAFDGIPRALLGHQITREHKRPVFPDSTPEPYKRLAERCWQADWDARPTFSEVLSQLMAMRAANPRSTPPVHIVRRPPLELSSINDIFWGGGGGANSDNNVVKTSGSLVHAGSPHTPHEAEPGDHSVQSVYLEHSLDDHDLIVMRTMSDWSDGGSGARGSASNSLGPAYSGKRSTPLPQIAEGEAGEHEAPGGPVVDVAAATQQHRLHEH